MKIRNIFVTDVNIMCMMCGMCLKNHSVNSSCEKTSPHYL